MINVLDLTTLFFMGSATGALIIRGLDNWNYFILASLWIFSAIAHGAKIKNRMNNE